MSATSGTSHGRVTFQPVMKTVHAFLALIIVGVVLAGTVASREAAQQAVAAARQGSGRQKIAAGAEFAVGVQSPSTHTAAPDFRQGREKPAPGTPAVAHEPQQPKSGQSVSI